MPIRTRDRSTLFAAALLTLGVAPLSSQTSHAGYVPLPSASGIRTADDAGSLLRDLYFKAQQFDAIALGDTLLRRFPANTRLRAWYVANVATSGSTDRADSLTKRIDTLSRDPWLLAARAFSRHYAPSSSIAINAQAIRLARRAHALNPREEDFVWLTAECMFWTPGFPSRGGGPTVAFIDSATGGKPRSIQVQVIRANAIAAKRGFDPGSPLPPDTASINEAQRLYAAAAAQDSTSYLALVRAGNSLRGRDDSLGLVLLKRAVALAPRSPEAHRLYWNAIDARRGPTAVKIRAIVADRDAFLAATDSAPWALQAAASVARVTKEPTAPFEEAILAKAPRSVWAEGVMLNRTTAWRESLFVARDTVRPGPKPDSAIAKQRFIAETEAFIAKPWTADPANRDRAILNLFFEVREDTTYPAAKLVTLIHQLVETRTGAPTFKYGEAVRTLSTRKLELPYAQQLAREGLKHTSSYVNEFPGYFFSSIGEQADALDGQNAVMHDQLGWAQFAAGNAAEGEKEVQRALDLTKKNVNIYFDLGRIQAAQGKVDEAELTFAQGMTVHIRGVNPNRAELARIYEKKNGSIAGWESYISSLEEKERSTRKARILAARDSQPRLVPGFTLADLSGRQVHSDSLKSQTVVINFWGTWCGPCVAEMPELQQFYDKYKNDKSVAIFTISNDKDLADLRDWMAKRKLTIPTLFDDGYVGKIAEIHSFPTTWFIDNTGRVQFRAVGNTGSLVEEWSWRLDATKAKPVIQP